MKTFLVIFFAVLYDAITGFLLFVQHKEKKKIDLSSIVLLCFPLINGILFPISYIGTNLGLNTESLTHYISMITPIQIIVYYVLAFLMFVIVLGTIRIGERSFKKAKPQEMPWKLNRNKDIMVKNMVVSGFIMLLMSFCGYYLYTRAYGGFIGYLKYSASIRSGIITVSNRFSFFIITGSFSYLACYIFYAVLFEGIDTYRKLSFVGFILSFGFSGYILYASLGRLNIILFILIILIATVIIKVKSYKKMIRLFLLLMVLCVPLFYLVSLFLGRSNQSMSISELIIKEISFPFANYAYIINDYNLGDKSYFRYFQDIIYMPLYVLPSRVWSTKMGIRPASAWNTYYFMGAFKGENGVTGEMPIDLLGLGYMQCGVFGVLAIAFLFGLLILMVMRITDRIKLPSVRIIMAVYLTLQLLCRSILYADPYNIVQRMFAAIVFAVVYWFISKWRKENI